ncbi:hypothetical protein ACXJJ3_32780 [Kribbella sp. WER1]
MSTNTAKQAEAQGESIVFEYAGTEYIIPAATEWPVRALRAIEEGQVATAMRSLLGAEVYDKFEAKATVRQLTELWEALSEAAGFAEGN